MNATGFDANTIEERPEPLEWPRSGGVGIISSLGVHRPVSQIVSQFMDTIAGRYSQPFDPLRSIRALRSINREILRWQPFWEELSTALDAYYEGNEDVFLEWVEKYIEHAPDGLLHEELRTRMPRSKAEFYPHGFLFHLKHHRHRLRIIDDPERFNEILSRIKLYGSLKQALDVLCAGSETTHKQRLGQLLEFTLHSEWNKPPPPGSDPNRQLVNEVSNLVRREARLEDESLKRSVWDEEAEPAAHNVALWHTATPQEEKSISLGQRLAPLDELPELLRFFEDAAALAPFLDVDNKLLLEAWLRDFAHSRLTQREFEVFEMKLRGHMQNEIAAHLGITKGRVSQLLKQARQKLADVA